MIAYCDSDYGIELDSRRSVTGLCVHSLRFRCKLGAILLE